MQPAARSNRLDTKPYPFFFVAFDQERENEQPAVSFCRPAAARLRSVDLLLDSSLGFAVLFFSFFFLRDDAAARYFRIRVFCFVSLP